MNPVLFTLGHFEIRYYGILLALAFLIGYLLLNKLAKEKNIQQKIVDDFFIILLPSMILGARIFEILFYNPGYYFSNPIKMLYIWEGGISSHGAILAAILVTYLFAKKYKTSFYRFADIVVIPSAIGASFVRLGNFINGEIVGTATNLPWAVQFTNYAGLRHPVQLYEALTLIIIFVLLYINRNKNLKQGTLFWSFILFYSTIRFFLEFLKEMPIFFLNLDFAQWASIILVPIALFFLIKINKSKLEK